MSSFQVYAFDPGSQKIGYALLKVTGQKLDLLRSGWESLGHGSKAERLYHSYKFVKSLLFGRKADVIAIESGYVGKGWQSSLVIAESRGVIIAAAGSCCKPVIEVPPSKAKMAVGLKGNANKVDVRFAVESIFGSQLKHEISEDEADACAIGLAASNIYQSAI